MPRCSCKQVKDSCLQYKRGIVTRAVAMWRCKLVPLNTNQKFVAIVMLVAKNSPLDSQNDINFFEQRSSQVSTEATPVSQSV